MENFIVSARKYRPATFDTVVGQHSITTTLKNAIKNNHLAQAFLFCGPRGVGKTTCARILAKTINCFNRTANIEACDNCESCKSFNTGNSLNVYELDAASNNSVDDIRNLIDQVRIPPQLGDYKVYIIDEVHMLSSQAFNAFLKTLEEPPRYAIFILATTEKHKIIPTILSRCQIFDFNRIQIDDIAGHLATIAKKEGITAEQDALHVIAQKADGALRDALSIFDQIVSFAGNNITYNAVIENLNILDYDYYFKLTDYILEGNIPSSLLLFNEVLNKGFDGHNFISGLSGHIRNLLVCKDAGTIQLLEVGNNIKDKYKEQSGKCAVPFLLRALEITNRTDLQYKSSKNQRLQVELCLMQLCSILTMGESKQQAVVIKSATPAPVRAPRQMSEPRPQYNSPPSSITNKPLDTAPAPAADKKKIVIKTGTPSIGGFLGKSKEQKNAEPEVEVGEQKKNTNLPKNSFTQQQLTDVWLRYTTKIKNTNPYISASLSGRLPILQEEFILEWQVDNASLQERFEKEEKLNLVEFLREELQNYTIQLTVVLNVEMGEKKLYTSQDKYKRMAEKNPAIQKFKQQFDLDIDY